MARPKTAILTRDKVIDAAIELIGADGLEVFSLPKLAAKLGVRAPSLYHYFTDKDDLLASVAHVVATPEPPAVAWDTSNWTDFLVQRAVALRSTIVAHPHCAPLLVRFLPRNNMFGEYEQTCILLRDGGVPSHLHARIVDGLTALTIGAAFLRENAADYADSGAGPSPDAAAHPALRTALDAVEGLTPDDLFGDFVRCYLAGVLRDA